MTTTTGARWMAYLTGAIALSLILAAVALKAFALAAVALAVLVVGYVIWMFIKR